MPEFVHTFRAGKMNKDLDERLIPEGEYRDALNLDVSASEGSSIGALENLKGTLETKNKSQNLSTGVYTEWGNDYISNLQNPISVGSIVDPVNERVYWFIASDDTSAIVEYDKNTKIVSPIVVDKNNILKFSSDYLITGINIIEGLLLWTDNQTEPKQLNIEHWRNSSTSFFVQSQIYGRDFIERDIVVIKPQPLKAPSITLSKNLGVGNTESTAVYNFTETSETSSSLASSIPVGTSITLNVGAPLTVNPGDILELTTVGDNNNGDPAVDQEGNDVVYTFVISVVSIGGGGTSVTGILQSGTSEIIGGTFDYQVKLAGEKVLFELKFPRFGYRYKYQNNQYSPFSPFSEVGFLPGDFEFNSKKGFNTGMVNEVKKITLGDFDSPLPADLLELDILYKESGNPAIYKVDTLKPEDLQINFVKHTLVMNSIATTPQNFSYTDSKNVNQTATLYPGATIVIVAAENTLSPTTAANVTITSIDLGTIFEVTSELIYALVQANQLLRPWDNVPLKAKAQEAISNRVIYANYVQNFNVSSDLKFNTSSTTIQTTGINSPGSPFKSVKTLRTYQLGVVFCDPYGRETPVFTDQTGVLPVDIKNSNLASNIKAQLETLSPKKPDGSEMFSSFKFFIKDPEASYYNVAADRMYESEDGESVWISMPSSETSKVSEDDYLILKKVHDVSEAVQNYPNNKFKVLAKKNEAPTELLKTKKITFSSSFAFEAVAGTGVPVDYKVPGATPVAGYDTFNLSDEVGENGIPETVIEKLATGAYIRFTNGIDNSLWYTIGKRQTDPAGVWEIRITLDRPFSTDVNFLYTDPQDAISPLVSIYNTIEIAEDVAILGKGQFEGRFFVRLEKTPTILNGFRAEAPLVPLTSTVVTAGYISGASKYTIFSGGGGALQNSAGTQTGGPTRQGYNVSRNLGGLNTPHPNNLGNSGDLSQIPFATGQPWDVVFEREINGNGDVAFWQNWKAGTFVKFSTHDTVYEILYVYLGTTDMNNSNYDRLYTRLDKVLEASISPWQIQNAGSPGNGVFVNGQEIFNGTDPAFVTVTILKRDDVSAFSSDNPAIFETEPNEQADLDIYYEISDAIPISQYNTSHELDWFNCYSYGNGVESNRIRDDFNAQYIDIGTKASSVLAEVYEEERLTNGLIWSGIFNSISSVNSLNQFIIAEAITKNIDPSSGPIQKLFARETDLLTFCEDKVVKILSDKDAIYNANGAPQLVANNRVLGQAMIPSSFGQFGIGSAPESFATYAYRVYFADNKKGRIMRLSADGVTVISEYGMSDFFSDNLPVVKQAIGFYDSEKGTYNIRLDTLTSEWDTKFVNKIKTGETWTDSYAQETTVSFDESVNGWTSRKSYLPEGGQSMDVSLYTFKEGLIHQNYVNSIYNNFYGIQYDSSVTLVTNDAPNVIKGFKTLNYSGSASRKYIYNISSAPYTGIDYNIAEIEAIMSNGGPVPTSESFKAGWYSSYTKTNLQQGNVKEFLDKEGKYFNFIQGDATYFNTNTDTNLDSHEFSMQGIGRAAVSGSALSIYNVHVFVNPACYESIGKPIANNMTYTIEEDCSSGSCVILQLSASDPN